MDSKVDAFEKISPPAIHLDANSCETACPDLSVVIPLLNEVHNVEALYKELEEVLSPQPFSFELIFVDDGSEDGTLARLEKKVARDRRVTLVQLARPFGQTAALAAGIDLASGRAIVLMDGDLQNDPRDIPRLLSKLDEPPGWDVVSGWRKNRHDSLNRRVLSCAANCLIGKLTWTDNVHDSGCTLKAYRAEVLKELRLYGEMHRFLPAICKWRGANITEIVVNHRPRVRGSSKYGLRRLVKVLFDLVTVKFLGDYLAKPIYFFGKLAMATFSLASLLLGVVVAQRLGYLTGGWRVPLNRNVLFLVFVVLFLVSFMLIMMGVLSELLVRIYHESRGIAYYKVRRAKKCGRDAQSDRDTDYGA